VCAGGVASGARTVYGGSQVVSSGGIAKFSTLSGGAVRILTGGVASGVQVNGGGGVVSVSSGGLASGTVVGYAGILSVASGGVISGTIVQAQGQDRVNGVASFTVVSGGLESLTNGGQATGTVVSNGGAQWVQTGGVASGTVLSSGGVMDLTTGGIATSTVVNSGGILILGQVFRGPGFESETPAGVASSTQVNNGGSIDLIYLAWQAGGSALVDPVTDILTVTEGGSSYQQQLSGNYTGLFFHVSSDGNAFPQGSIPAGTLVTVNTTPPCFVAGTRIATETGEVRVEELQPGDRVMLHDGRVAPIVWIGHRQVDCARHSGPALVWPVRVAAGAFGPGQPRRDLFLSPDHAIFVTDVLIPVKHLINGTSIVQVVTPDVAYFHVELSAHDVLIAEGLPTETYLDTGDRSNFANGGGAIRLHPDFSARVWEGRGYAPLIVTGPKLEAVRRQVEAWAAAGLIPVHRHSRA
jgi:autotransporter passenger strand-loop-strand repeat protein